MIRFVKQDCDPLHGEVIYRAHEYSFDFDVKSESELALRAGNKGTTSLLLGTLQIEIGIETGLALFAWGLHSPSTQWLRYSLPSISADRGCVKVQFDNEPIIGVSQSFAEVGEWQTAYDVNTGWICVSENQHDVAKTHLEFAKNTIAGLTNEKLVSLWLRPLWHQQPFDETPSVD